jgi:sugar transferase (PEP-CTERM/EpsH1 system associated)
MSDLLYLACRMPRPPARGEDGRAWHVLRHLAAQHRVHLGCFYERPPQASDIDELTAICASVMCLPLSRAGQSLKRAAAFTHGTAVSGTIVGDVRLSRWIGETMAQAQPSLAFVSGSPMTPYIQDYRIASCVVDMVEVVSERWRQAAQTTRWPLNDAYWRQERAMLAAEMRAASRANQVLFASSAEANLFARRAPRLSTRLAVMRNGIDHDYFKPRSDYPNPFPAGRKIVVMAGPMDYPPNIEGAHWFATEVMTMLRHRFSTLDFWIVGGHPTHAVRSLVRGDIHLAQRMSDIRPYLAHADAIVAPLRIARGFDNNVLEGMAMAKPVIATPAALDGLGLTIGAEVLGSASGPGFASAVATALSGRAGDMGARARQRIEAEFGWSAVLQVLDAALLQDGVGRMTAS